MSGLVIPSLLQQEQSRKKLTAQQLAHVRSIVRAPDSDPDTVPLGNGLAVDRMGKIVQLKRVALPTRMEADDMQEMVQRFQEFLMSEGREIKTRATDPTILPQPYVSPPDFSNEFGVPVDTTEIITLCDETGLYRSLPEVVNGSKTDSWREMDSLAMTSGANWVAFEAGGCPEETTLGSTGKTIDKKHIGAKKTLSESDLQHSIASIAAGYGMRELIGPTGSSHAPGESIATFARQNIANVKEKEILAQWILVLNGWDELLVKGSVSANSEEFNGFENYVTAANGARTNSGVYSGTFTASRFDEWLAAGCAKPTHLFGHPTALQALKLGYWQLGSTPQNQLNFSDGGSIQAGWTFIDSLHTSIGPLVLVPDSRFTRTDHSNGTFTSSLFAMRMSHNGEPLVYKATQIPLAFKDLAPGCSAISFVTWAVTALVIKHMCAHGFYSSIFNGLVQDGCGWVHSS